MKILTQKRIVGNVKVKTPIKRFSFFLGECFEVFFTHQVYVLVVVNFETVNFVSHFEIDLDCGQLITKLESRNL